MAIFERSRNDEYGFVHILNCFKFEFLSLLQLKYDGLNLDYVLFLLKQKYDSRIS